MDSDIFSDLERGIVTRENKHIKIEPHLPSDMIDSIDVGDFSEITFDEYFGSE